MNMSLKGMLKSLNAKPGQVVSNPFARAFAPLKEAEGQDHEVSMAKGSLEAMIKHCNELMQKLGEGEKDIPGWIQDHIAKAENYIQQANTQYHEYGTNESVNEATTSWSRMMQGVRAGDSGPWSLVGIENNKVVAQKNDIKDKNLLPAHFEAMRRENPKAKIHIEDGGGHVVWNEKK